MTLGRPRAVLTLGITQTIGYASSIYLPAATAGPMARAVGLAPSAAFMALSAALLLQVVTGPWVGRLVDRDGGRGPLASASLIFAAGLAGLACAQTPVQMFGAWLVIGFAMAAGLYDTAFAGLVGWFGAEARGPITGVTLIAGFASTIGWPLTSWLVGEFGWRNACLAWAAANLLLALPLHLSLPRRPVTRSRPARAPGTAPPSGELRAMILVAVVLALLAAIGSAMAATLPQALAALGAAPGMALFAAALVGPAQVGARLGELVVFRRLHPLQSGLLAVALVGAGLGLLVGFGAQTAVAATVVYGAGIGLFTIVRGALPLALFGEHGYGQRLGILSVPSRLSQAAAPFLFALALEVSPRLSLAILGLAACLGFAALLGLRGRAAQEAAA